MKKAKNKSTKLLQKENEELRIKLTEAEETINAIRNGQVDAIIVSGDKKEHIYSLSGAESIYRHIVESMQEAAFTTTIEGTILFCNIQFGNLIKRKMENIIGHNLSEFLAKEEKEKVIKILLNIKKKSIKQRILFEDINGAPVPLHISSNTLNQQEGNCICFIGNDLSNIEKFIDELRKSNVSLEQYAYITSHDMQEPIRMVSGFLSLLENKYGSELDKKALKYINFAKEGSQRMLNIIHDLLEYSRIGRTDMDIAPTNANECLKISLDNLKILIIEATAKITYDAFPTLHNNKIQLIQIFQNLISNALKFRNPQKKCEIHIGYKNHDDSHIIYVRDNGIGIDLEQHIKIFEPFQRLHSKEKYPGSGIGLAICKKIVENQGGQIWLESKAGEGSTFYISFSKKN